MNPKIKLFVYGTLMRGNSNYEDYLSGGRFLGDAVLKDFALYDLGKYPGIIPIKGGRVKGEVFEVGESTKSRIDGLEEEGSLYTARKAKVTLSGGETIEVLTYVYNRSIENAVYVPEEEQPWKLNKKAP